MPEWSSLRAGVRVFGVRDAPFESLSIGEPVRLALLRDHPDLTLLAFRPRR